MGLSKDILEAEVRILGASKAAQDIALVDKSLGDLIYKNKELRAEQTKLVADGKKNTAQYKNLGKEIKANNELIDAEKKKRTELQSQLKLNELTYNQLSRRQSELKKSLNNTSKELSPDTWRKYKMELDQVEKQMQKTGTGVGKIKEGLSSFNSMFSKLSIAGIITGGATGVWRSLVKVKEIAQELQGAHVRNTTVLGDSYGYVAMQAEKLATKMGLTKTEFISNATATADLLVPLDFARDKAAKMATQIQSLSGALNEWTAGKHGTTEISNILTKAMLGEMEQLKNLGIAIRMDDEEYRNLYKEKLKQTEGNAGQARSLTILELIYKKSVDAQTAYAGSGNELLRTQASLRAGWKGMKESLIEYVALSKQERLQKQYLEHKAVSEALVEQDQNVQTLISTYKELSGKSNLSESEQKKLNGTLRALGEIAPYAISKYDDYGNALEINIDKLKRSVQLQEKLNGLQEQKLASDMIDELKDQINVIDKNQSKLTSLNNVILSYQENIANGGRYVKLANGGYTDLSVTLTQYENAQKKCNQELVTSSVNATQNISNLIGMGVSYEKLASILGVTTDRLKGFIAQANGSSSPILPEKGLLAVAEERLKTAQNMSTATEKEIIARNQAVKMAEAELERLRNLGIEKDDQAKKAKERAESEAKERKDAIRNALDVVAKENLAFAERLTKAGMTEREITGIKAVEESKRSALQKEKLSAYEAIYAEHQSNLMRIDEREREYRKNLIVSENDFAKEDDDHQKRLKDAGITENEITLIKAKAAADQTAIEREKIQVFEILNTQHAANIARIETESIKTWQTKQKELFDSKVTKLKTEHNNEIVSVTTLEQAKNLLREQYHVADVDSLKSLGDAKKAIRNMQQREEEAEVIAFYNLMAEKLSLLMNGASAEGINLVDQIMTPEQVAQISEMIDQVKLKRSELFAGQSSAGSEDTSQDQEPQFSFMSDEGRDIFGMSPDDWELMYANLEQGKIGMEEMIGAVTVLSDAYNQYNSFMCQAENQRMREFERNTNSKKRKLQDQLNAGIISQQNYDSKVAELDRELDQKKADLELKQAKREKAAAVMSALINTAVGITAALKAGPIIGLVLAAIVGAMGALQVAMILSQPLPGAERGGLIGVRREQDGKYFDAEFSPQRRGYVNKPTVIVGENGPEYVIPNEGLANPDIASFVSAIEGARLQGNLRSLDISAMQSHREIAGRAKGGYVRNDSPNVPASAASSAGFISQDPQFIELLKKLSSHLEKPQPAVVAMVGPGGIVEQQKAYDKFMKSVNIQNNA